MHMHTSAAAAAAAAAVSQQLHTCLHQDVFSHHWVRKGNPDRQKARTRGSRPGTRIKVAQACSPDGCLSVRGKVKLRRFQQLTSTSGVRMLDSTTQ
jgi:hypothetical protein